MTPKKTKVAPLLSPKPDRRKKRLIKIGRKEKTWERWWLKNPKNLFIAHYFPSIFLKKIAKKEMQYERKCRKWAWSFPVGQTAAQIKSQHFLPFLRSWLTGNWVLFLTPAPMQQPGKPTRRQRRKPFRGVLSRRDPPSPPFPESWLTPTENLNLVFFSFLYFSFLCEFGCGELSFIFFVSESK